MYAVYDKDTKEVYYLGYLEPIAFSEHSDVIEIEDFEIDYTKLFNGEYNIDELK